MNIVFSSDKKEYKQYYSFFFIVFDSITYDIHKDSF